MCPDNWAYTIECKKISADNWEWENYVRTLIARKLNAKKIERKENWEQENWANEHIYFKKTYIFTCFYIYLSVVDLRGGFWDSKKYNEYVFN